MQLNFNFKFKNLEGKEEQSLELPVAKYVANILASGRSSDPIKIRQIAIKLYNNGIVDIDKSDLILIHDLIKNSEVLVDNAKAQILEVILPLLKS